MINHHLWVACSGGLPEAVERLLSQHTPCGCELDLKPGGCTMYTSSSNSPCRNVFFTSMWWRRHHFAVASEITVRTIVIFATRRTLYWLTGVDGTVLHLKYPDIRSPFGGGEERTRSHVPFLESACISSFIASTHHRSFAASEFFSSSRTDATFIINA